MISVNRSEPRESYKLEFVEPFLPDTTNAQTSYSWQRKHKASLHWNRIIHYHVMKLGRPAEPLKKAKLTLIRRSSVQPDYDGLVSSFKVVIDALRHNKVLCDDKMQNVGIPTYSWEKAKPKEGSILVIVEEVKE